jgi:predicted nucleotidyltransferase
MSSDEEQSILDTIVRAISALPGVKRIILFGSRTEGRAQSDSDFDICVVADAKGRKIELLRAIRGELFASLSNPLDMVIYTSAEFEDRSALSTSFEGNIARKGIPING